MSEESSLPIGDGDTVVLPASRRLKGLPTIYQALKHAQRDTVRHGRVFYYIEDLSRSNMEKVSQLETKLRIPQGSEAEAVGQGWSA